MKAAVLMGPNRLEVAEVETPRPGPVDVLIRVEACAVCSSDVALIDRAWLGQPPYGSFIPGHEYSGTVAAVGEGVSEFKEGDRVSVEAHLGCLRCINCRRGNYTACLNFGDTAKGHRANGFTTNGGFAQYVVNHINTVYRIPETVGFDEAALLTNLGCVLYGFETMGGYVVGDNVVVIGPGPLGLLSVQVAKILGAKKVFLIGTREARLKTGIEVSADRVINIHDEDPLKVILDETDGIGADVVVETSGGAEAPQMAIALAKRMGKILMLGLPDDPVQIDLSLLVNYNKSIYTVRGEGRANCARGVSLLSSGRVNLKPLLTHAFPLARITEAFETFTERKGGAIKVVVNPNRG
jgi:2-desacetyl-2-hydroxyethyl bacteriochlorophyllide A dehydrogenase